MIGIPANLSDESILWAAAAPLLYGMLCLRVNRAAFSPILVAAFVVGFLTSYVAYITEMALQESGFQIGANHAWLSFSTLVAIPEETVKLAALIGLVHKVQSRERKALAIACFIGCGFASSENLIYLQRFGNDVIAARLLTATAFHVFNAILMARILVSKSIADESARIAFALAIPVVLHGTYDYLITQSQSDGGRFVFVLGFAVAAGLATLRAYPALEATAVQNDAKI